MEALEDAKKVLEVQNDVLSSEVVETTEQNNKLVGHNNHKQKIHMHSKVMLRTLISAPTVGNLISYLPL